VSTATDTSKPVPAAAALALIKAEFLMFFLPGMMGHRALLSAVALGLCGRPVGAFYDVLTSDLVQAPLQEEWPVHYVAVGTP
jgi:hypothetical protein